MSWRYILYVNTNNLSVEKGGVSHVILFIYDTHSQASSITLKIFGLTQYDHYALIKHARFQMCGKLN